MAGGAVAAPRGGRRTAYATLACTLVAGIVVFLESVVTNLPGSPWPVWWWVSFTLLVVVQLVATGLVPRPAGTPVNAWLTALVVLALTTFLLYADHGLTAAFIVVSAAAVARHASTRALAGVIALQTVVATTGIALVGWPVVDVVAGIVVYAGFQSFGALVVLAARRETEARHELTQTHAALRSTVARLEEVSRDAERLRISRDLHDVIGHQLTALILELEVASHHVGGSEAEQHVLRARTVAKGLLADVRATVGEMRTPPAALGPRLSAIARDVRGLEVSVRVVEDVPIDDETAQTILRCVQEAITNTLRHAEADHLDVVVEARRSGLQLRAVDDGRGAADVELGHGLTGMRERMEALGGSLEVRSRRGEGFVIEGRVPAADGLPVREPA
jgi:signal transduction histidine kinase